MGETLQAEKQILVDELRDEREGIMRKGGNAKSIRASVEILGPDGEVPKQMQRRGAHYRKQFAAAALGKDVEETGQRRLASLLKQRPDSARPTSTIQERK